jgi:catalase
MRKTSLISLATLSLLSCAALAQDIPDPEQLVNSFEKLTGVHPGLRRNHAKGSCAVGQFVGTAEARKYSASALFSGKPVPVTARFSLAGPNPAVPDFAHSPRGLGLQFQLPGGDQHNMAMLNLPFFPVATVQEFYENLQLDLPDPATGKPDAARKQAFVASHPQLKALGEWLGSHNPAPSYGRIQFNSLHAFKMIGADMSEHWVRWSFVPKAGVAYLGDEQAKAMPADFLDADLAAQARKGKLQWEMVVIVGEKGDVIDDPSRPWPDGRKQFKAGTLTLAKGGKDAAGSCEDINYDPNQVAAGIETSPDQILLYRSQAYAVSYSRRVSEK